jgi:hypothetical protein
MNNDDDFDGFSSTVGQVTITPDEEYLIGKAVADTNLPDGGWSALTRLAYWGIVNKELKRMKEENPNFIASAVTINTKDRKVIIT